MLFAMMVLHLLPPLYQGNCDAEKFLAPFLQKPLQTTTVLQLIPLTSNVSHHFPIRSAFCIVRMCVRSFSASHASYKMPKILQHEQ